MKKIFFCMFLFFISSIFSIADNTLLYDQSFLKQCNQVRDLLIKEGFQRVTFTTPDGLKLKGLFLSRSNALCTVIVCAGWLPGRSENMATFYALLPDYCNILLFEARGRGESEGSLFGHIWRYGVNEYKDVLGAIACARQFSQLPVVICGICSGAFNAAHALIVLEEKHLIEKLSIKGLVFDSGWGSVEKISRTVFVSPLERFLINFYNFVGLGFDKSRLKKSYFYMIPFASIKMLYSLMHILFYKPFVGLYETKTNLFNHIHTLQVPVFFIHYQDDFSASIKEAQKLASLAARKQCWWIADNSYHAKNHIYHNLAYAQHISLFMEAVIETKNSAYN